MKGLNVFYLLFNFKCVLGDRGQVEQRRCQRGAREEDPRTDGTNQPSQNWPHREAEALRTGGWAQEPMASIFGHGLFSHDDLAEKSGPKSLWPSVYQLNLCNIKKLHPDFPHCSCIDASKELMYDFITYNTFTWVWNVKSSTYFIGKYILLSYNW